MLLSTTAMITSSLLLSLSPGTLLNSKARVILSNKVNLVNFLKLIQSSILDYKAELLTKSTKSLSNVSSHQLVFIHDFTFSAFFSFSSFSHSVMSNSLWPHRLQHARLPCPSLTPRTCSNLCPKLVMPFIHLILCHPLLLLSSIFPSIRVFSNE